MNLDPRNIGSSPDRLPIAPGVQVAAYRLEARLGEGGMGVVYRALDTKLNRPVAIKFLSDDLADAAARRRFQREAQMASSLNHPHILTVHDAGELQGRQYLVTEFVDGSTLREWAKAGKRTWKQVVEVLIGVADGLAAAHAADILHRDVKPENVLVGNNGYAKLADFGLAKLAEPSNAVTRSVIEGGTRPGVVIGTIAYMSPEQASGQPVDARSDIFSFGVMLYELLAGRRPFAAATDLELLQTVIHVTPAPLPADLPVGLRLAVDKALEKNPADRYQTARDLVVDLRRALRAEVQTSAPAIVAAAPRRRRWGLMAAIASLIVVSALGVLWRLWQQDYFWSNPLVGARIERLTDFEGDELDGMISADGKLAAFVADRDGQFDAWVTQLGTGQSFINITRGQYRVSPIGGPGRFVGFATDSEVWFLSNMGPNRFMMYLSPALGGAARAFRENTVGPAFSADGTRVVYQVGAQPGDPLEIADRNGSHPRRIFGDKPGVHNHNPTWSPDGRYIYFLHGNLVTNEMDIWRIPSTATSPTAHAERITRHNATITYLDWLDPRTLIYSGTAEDGSGQWLYAMDVERRIPHRVSSGIAEQYQSVSMSKTRPRRLIATIATPSASLWEMTISDGVQTEAAFRRVVVPNTRALAPHIVREDLLFLSSKGGGDGLYKLENGAVTELWRESNAGVIAAPAASPDGSRICFASRRQGRSTLQVMNANGANVRPLSESESLDVRSGPSWSPDGKWVTVAANDGGGTRIFKVPVDGGAPVRLVETISLNPVWSAGSDRIVYYEPQVGAAFKVKAVAADGSPVHIADIQIQTRGEVPFRLVAGGKAAIVLGASPRRGPARYEGLFWMDLSTGEARLLAEFKASPPIRSFDVSPDGKRIVFDRVRDNADIVMMELAR